jgi:multicomponent Na+:H+ antiporter subunit E
MSRMKSGVYILLPMACWWLVLSGNFSLFLLSGALFSLIITLYILKKMELMLSETPLILKSQFWKYLPWLLKEIIASAWAVVRSIISRTTSPTLAKVQTSLATEREIALYGNSITLTPGTVTIDLNENSITVHALNKKGIEDLNIGYMEKRVDKTI